MLNLEKQNASLTIRLRQKSRLFSSLLTKALLISIALHLLCFLLFQIARPAVEEGILLLPTKVEADKYLFPKPENPVSIGSSGLLLTPIAGLSHRQPSLMIEKPNHKNELIFLSYETPLPSFSQFDEPYLEKEIAANKKILYISVVGGKKAFFKKDFNNIINSLNECSACYHLSVEGKSGKVISYTKQEGDSSLDQFAKELCFDKQKEAIIDTVVELSIVDIQ